MKTTLIERLLTWTRRHILLLSILGGLTLLLFNIALALVFITGSFTPGVALSLGIVIGGVVYLVAVALWQTMRTVPLPRVATGNPSGARQAFRAASQNGDMRGGN